MPEYLIHRNGRGRLYEDAEANISTHISRDSSAKGMSKLRDCALRNGSVAEGKCQIFGGFFDASLIKGVTIVAGNPLVASSVLDCVEVSGSPEILNSGLEGFTEVCDSPRIMCCVLRDAIVYGSPVLDGTDGGFCVSGRVHEGYWTRPPMHITLPWCNLSECINGKLLLECWCRPVEWWLRFGSEKAVEWGWSRDQIDVTLSTIEQWFPITCVAQLRDSSETAIACN